MNELFANQLPPEHPSHARPPFARFLCVKNRARAEMFYRSLFRHAAIMANARFTFFDWGGFIFGLFEPETECERLQFCRCTVPQLRVQVADVRAEFKKIRAMTVRLIMPLQRSAGTEHFQFLDTEGNTVEFFARLADLTFMPPNE